MATDLEVVKRKQEDRFRVLQAVYEATDGELHTTIPDDDISTALGINDNKIDRLIDYLCNEGLLDRPHSGPYVAITHQGVREVEEFVQDPQKGTRHFQFGNLTQNFYGSVGVNQTGENTATVTMNVGANTSDILDLVRQLRGASELIPSDKRGEFKAEVDDLEHEVKQPDDKPNKISKINRGLAVILALASGIESVKEIVSKIMSFIPGIS